MTPMFSAYVVVGDPPTEVAITVPTPSAATARPITGSRSCPVISATALTWPTFSATSAITAGSTSSAKVSEKLGQVPADRRQVAFHELVADETVGRVRREAEPVGALHARPVHPPVGRRLGCTWQRTT